jgi:hypothetical protein
MATLARADQRKCRTDPAGRNDHVSALTAQSSRQGLGTGYRRDNSTSIGCTSYEADLTFVVRIVISGLVGQEELWFLYLKSTSLSELTAEIEAFLREHIESFEELEVLLLVHERSEVAWTNQEVAAELRIGAEATQRALRRLLEIELVEQVSPEPRYRYNPSAPQAWRADETAKAYQADRLAILNALSKQAIERIRMSAARTFADAFRLGGKRRKEDG